MPRDLASRVRAYAGMVEVLPRYDEWVEVTNLFVTRELIEDELRRGAKLPMDVSRELEAADAALVRRRRRVLRRFPELFAERPLDLPRCYWWWYLDEGPQVREHVRGVA